jgi:glycine/D-amino acid oxidase-like deaminating enzyme
MNTPPWFVPRPAPYSEPAPNRAEVVVIGAGPTGLSAARVLADAGTDVVVLEARPDVGQGFSSRIPGLVGLGTAEHAHRLALALGMPDTAELFAFTRANLALARDWLLAPVTGGLCAAAMPGEEKDIESSRAVLTELGVATQDWTSEQACERLGACHLGPSRFTPEEALVDPTLAVHRLAKLASDAGAHIHTDHRVLQVDETSELIVLTVQGTVKAEAVIWACGATSHALQPAFAKLVWPVRIQSVATAPGDGSRGPPGRGQHGHLIWRTAPDGARVLAGCRWATPHLEVGETHEDVLNPRVDDRLRAVLARTWPGSVATRSWAGIAAFTCDGLPLLGPLPGQPRQMACLGFGGSDWSFALRGGQAVAQGLLMGKIDGLPDRFSLSRFT